MSGNALNPGTVLFAATLFGVAWFHHHTLRVALIGLGALTIWRFAFTDFDPLAHLIEHGGSLVNLFGLLVGFAIVADHFERSGVPKLLPRWLPDDWRGPFALACAVFVLSAFLDNIAAAVIGGGVASTVFSKRVHIGYLATLVAAANAGGAGSVIGDTTTTMMWIHGIAPSSVLPAYVASVPALLVTAAIGSVQQDRYQRILKDPPGDLSIDLPRVGVVGLVLAVLVAANIALNTLAPALAEHWPALALALWGALLATSAVRAPAWSILPEATRGSLFLVALVLAASLVPIEGLPDASPAMTVGLGALSALFDNIPLTALALQQGGYDYALLAYAVGFGGSMMWFGSSAGVAITSEFPDARDAMAWLRHAWHVPLAYVIGIAVYLTLCGWHPNR